MKFPFIRSNVARIEAVILIAYFLAECYIYKSSLFSESILLISRVATVPIAVILLLIPKDDSMRTLGLSSIALGIVSVSQSYIVFLSNSYDALFIIQMMVLLFGVVLILNGLALLTKYIGNAESVKYAVLFLLMFDFFIYLILLHFQIDWEILLYMISIQFPRTLWILSILAIIYGDGISKKSTPNIIRESLFEIESGLSMGNDVSMSRETLMDFLSDDKPENSFPLKSEKNTMVLMIRRYDSGEYVMFKDVNNISGMGGLRFKLLRTVPEGDAESCRIVRFYGEGGILVQLRVFDKVDNIGERLFHKFNL